MSVRVRHTVAICATALAATAIAQAPRPEVKYTLLHETDTTSAGSPSLSPDGKWIAYTGEMTDYRRGIWLVPVDRSKKAERLIPPPGNDEFAQWLGSDRIVFKSSRVQGALMTIRIDLATGKAIGTPQRLTLEPAGNLFAASPDGKWVVYSSAAKGKSELRLIPSTGGPARTLATLENALFNSPHFTPDGSAVEYVEAHRLAVGLMRVPTSGGTPTVIVPVGAYPEGFLVPANDLLLRGRFPRMGGDYIKEVTVLSRSGDTLAKFQPRNAPGSPPFVLRPTAQRGVFLTSGSLLLEQTHVVGVDGGNPRTVLADVLHWGGNSDRETFWPIRWTVDGSGLYYSQAGAIGLLQVSSGKRALIATPPAPAGTRLGVISHDGRLIHYAGGVIGDTIRAHLVYDTKTKRMHTLTTSEYFYRFERLTGPGGENETPSSNVLYTNLNADNDNVEIRQWNPDAPSRLLRTIPKDIVLHTSVAVHGERVVYQQQMGDSAKLMIGVGPTAPAKVLTTLRGRIEHLAFSHDGRTLVAAVKSGAAADTTMAILFIGVAADGSVSTPARLVATENSCSDFSWLPDDQSVVALCYPETAPYTRIIRFPVREGARQTIVTANERYPHYDYVISPDGRNVAYSVEREPHGSIWRVEIPALKR